MVTITVNQDTTVNDRKMFRGGTYAVSQETAGQAIREQPNVVRVVTDGGPSRRDKSLRSFRTL